MATIKYENLDIENVDVKEEVDSLENRHHDDVGETRLENIQGQDPLEPALSLEDPVKTGCARFVCPDCIIN